MKLQKHEREALSAVRRMGLGVVAQLYPDLALEKRIPC